ncbi:MAG: site-2 protease family protein [Clostridiaceae bacterium]|nr:site-2 protease family protein [Clostridiaceae bacterium]
MIRTLLNSGLSFQEMILHGMVIFLVLSYSLSIHEFMHGFSAVKLGDDTPRLQGRLTMNPLAHLDPIGSLMMLLVGFGWAKPVQVNYSRLTRFKNRSISIRIVSLAGVTANFLSAFIACFLFNVITLLMLRFNAGFSFSNPPVIYATSTMLLSYLFEFNLLLMAFNLLPIPPLDGFHVLETLIPYKYREKFHRYEQYFSMAFFALIMMGFFLRVSPLITLVNFIRTPFEWLITKPIGVLFDFIYRLMF